jgi:hypothetical protein
MFDSGELADLLGAEQPEVAGAPAPPAPANPQQSPPLQID